MKRPTSREADTLSRITSFRPVHVTTGEHQEAAIFPKKVKRFTQRDKNQSTNDVAAFLLVFLHAAARKEGLVR